MKTKLTFGIVALFTLILRFIPISFGDVYNDGALYSFRAYGWFDWLGKSAQTTPFDWLGHFPFWARLSFHDAPPLTFFIQNIFFNLFGDSVFVLRLPFVLAGVGSIILVYFLLKKLTDGMTASIAVVLYSFISYGVWAGHMANLEGIEEIFIVGSVFFGALYLFKDQNKKYIYIWSAFTACALLVKYTALFLIPPIVIYMFIYRGAIKKHIKSIITSTILFFVLISPVLIYNLNVYALRGHFDVAISSMVGMHPADFGDISSRALSFNSVPHYTDIFFTLATNVSYPLFLLMGVCLIILIWRARWTGLHTFESWILCNIFFMLLLFGFSGAPSRYLSILAPFIVIVVAIGIKHLWDGLENKKLKYLFASAVIVIFCFELTYSFNTNFMKKPFGSPRWMYSENKIQNMGFNQLDNFIRNNIIVGLPDKQFVKVKDELILTRDDIQGRKTVIYDDRINWFAQMWYLQRYSIYHHWPVISTSYLSPNSKDRVYIAAFLAVSGKPAYFVYPINPEVIDPMRDADTDINSIGPIVAGRLDVQGVPVTIIKNSNGIPVFKVYTIGGL
jgi:hypothetical protein